jgi:hypothetical protein
MCPEKPHGGKGTVNLIYLYTVKPVHVVTSIKQSPVKFEDTNKIEKRKNTKRETMVHRTKH